MVGVLTAAGGLARVVSPLWSALVPVASSHWSLFFLYSLTIVCRISVCVYIYILVTIHVCYHRMGNCRRHEIFAIFAVGLILRKYYSRNNHCYTGQIVSLIHCNGASVNIFDGENFPSYGMFLLTKLSHVKYLQNQS